MSVITLDYTREAERSLGRLLPRLEQRFAQQSSSDKWATFKQRLAREFPHLFALLLDLYGDRYDFFYHLEQILETAALAWAERPSTLKALDKSREQVPNWYTSNQMLGGVCYVDLFADNLDGIREKIPYFKELGLTYLHLMPLFDAPEGDSDGGYAISDYRSVASHLGTMAQLRTLADELRDQGISLVLDFVFNHTSDEHRWAKEALAGDPEYMEYFFVFPDRAQPDEYDRHLREIFPDQHPGSFTQHRFADGVERWVWTTFNTFQWDLNYRNPSVFCGMASEMLFLANAGVEILRLDALAFTWKEMGTDCENLPKAHTLVQAFNALLRIAAPTLLFKSEAIVHPDEVIKYIDLGECQLSYNPLLMALLWESLATRKVELLQHAMEHRFQTPAECAWVNYIRVHDDIGWTFDDGDAGMLGINGFDHRRFLNTFYTGRFPGSFASGLPFQENPATGDARISGTLASLAGLEKAINEQDAAAEELAINRILLLHAIILSIGGIPLIYLGDEVGQLNEYSFRDDPDKANDSRWVHRPAFNEGAYAKRHDAETIPGRIFHGLQHLIKLRKSILAFHGQTMQIVNLSNPHVFAFVRTHGDHQAIVVASFSENQQSVNSHELLHHAGSSHREMITDQAHELDRQLVLEPYQVLWLDCLRSES